MNERADIQFGQTYTDHLLDSDGEYVDLTGATVVFQYRIDCRPIISAAGTVIEPSTGKVAVLSSIPVGAYNIRWKVTLSGQDTYYPDYGWDQLIIRAIDECSTFELFVSEVSRTVFPEGEAENLVANHRKYITDALIDLQQKVPCLRTEHRDRISVAETFTECAASVLSAPKGFIAQIYAVTQDNCCSKRYFQPIDWDEMDQILKDNQRCGFTIEPTYYYYLDDYGYFDYPAYGCLYYGDSSGATDLPARPSLSASFSAMKGGQLYLFPWLQSNEVLVIEWDGIKRNWSDTDEVQFNREVQDAVEHFLDRRSASREDCDIQRIQLAQADYDTIVAKQIWQCRKERRIERRQHYFSNCSDFCNAATRVTGAGSLSGPISEIGDCIVDNYADLRALNTNECISCKVLGYATAFDGGGGIFIREANSPPQSDNDGTIVVSSYNSSYYWRKWF